MKTAEDICSNFREWPSAWEGLPEDVPYGRAILKIMTPFIEHLISKGLTKKTISRHMDNLWLLGGEIIRDIATNEEYDIPAIKKNHLIRRFLRRTLLQASFFKKCTNVIHHHLQKTPSIFNH